MIPISDPDIRRRSFPYVNVAIIIACAAVLAYELSIGSLNRQLFFYRWGLIPEEVTTGHSFTQLVAPGVAFDIESPIPTWGTLFSSMFIHADILHFIFNMVFLWVFGDNVEDRLGHVKYLLFYLAAGLVAAFTQVALDRHGEIPMIGASGAIAGVLGAYLVLYPFSRIRTLIIFLFITYVSVPAVFLLGFWFFLQFVEGLGSLGPSAQSGGTAYWAHIGGFLFGVALLFVLKLLLWRQPLWRRTSRFL